MPDTVTARPQDVDWFKLADWLKRHEELLARRDSLRDTQVVFFGDSITEGWLGEGKAAWEKHFAKYHPLNLGIGGDETQHLMFRMHRGTLDGIAPKALVLLIGTNNIGNSGFDATQTAEGVRAVVAEIRKRLPATMILLLAVFPRDEQPGTRFRNEIELLNAQIAKLHDRQAIHYVDYAQRFLIDGNILPKALFPDSLHLSPAAYEILAHSIANDLGQLLSNRRTSA